MSTTAYQGQTVTVSAEFIQSGVLVDQTGVTIQITDPAGTVEVAATSIGVTRIAVGIYQYSWLVPAAAPVGNHVAVWQDTSSTSVSTLVVVQAASSATWCTLDDVKAVTGITVTTDVLLQAGSAIDIAAARPYAVDHERIGSRDLYYLKLACSYQAAWLASQFDAFQRMDITALGQSRSITQFGPNAMTLAPNTKKALKRVSWLKARSLHIRSPFTDGQGAIGMDPMSSAVDGMYPWSPL
jgi:hypothetical protein